MPAQHRQRIRRIAGPESRLDIGDENLRMRRKGGGAGHAGAERRPAVGRLERIPRAGQPPDLVELEPVQRGQADLAMARPGGNRSEERPEGQERARTWRIRWWA